MKRIISMVLVNAFFCVMFCGCIAGKAENYVDDNGREWKYCLELQGEINGGSSTITVYTDNEELQFEQVWKSIISSDIRETETIPEFYLVKTSPMIDVADDSVV